MRNIIRLRGESSKKRELNQNVRRVRLADLKDRNQVIGRNQFIDIFSGRPLIHVVDGQLYVDLTISSEDLNANDSNMGVRDSGRNIENQSSSNAGQSNPNLTLPSSDSSVIRDHKKGKPKNKRQGSRLRRNSNVEKNVGKNTMLCWMVDMGTIQPNDRVYYMDESKSVLLDGIITRGGIRCNCCHAIVTISEFEIHSGSKSSDPLKNICLEGGASLLHSMLEAWNKQDESKLQVSNIISVADEDINDNTCIICGDYGNLLCCDSCPSTFHQSCLQMDVVPPREWHCSFCCCKICGLVKSQLATYHDSCVEAGGGMIVQSDDAFFCGNKCQEISEKLERLVGVTHNIEDGFSWTLIRRSNVDFDDFDMKFHMVEWNSKLALALSLMYDCFQPCIDGRTNINILDSVLYNCW